MFTLDMRGLYEGTAKLAEIDTYLENIRAMPLDGEHVVLTGEAPIWLYLKVAHALHGRGRSLSYKSPALGRDARVTIFDHNPY